MASCKDCVHVEVCCEKNLHVAVGMNIIPRFKYKRIEQECKNFKDRSRFVELPCKVGDTVYIYAPGLIYNPSIVEKAKVLLIQIHSKDDIRIFLCDEHCDKFWITLDTFIKGVKFNKEEAEQALKLKTGDKNA